MRITLRQRAVTLTAVLFATAVTSAGVPARADHTPDPTTVTIAGSLQSELGCPGDWQPECATTHLAFDADDEVWQGTFAVPTGDWEYKAPVNDTWDENYGAGGVQNGPNLPLSLTDPTDVKFFYSHHTHWITDNHNSVIATAPGSYQSELGCPGDWQPDCLRSWLQDADGDGVYTFSTDQIPAGDYEFKVALDEAWTVNYGAGGVQDGPNIPFTVEAGQTVTFSFDAETHVPSADVVGGGGPVPGAEELVRPALRHPFTDEILYFTIPDRFDNGTTTNDCGDYAGTCIPDDTQANVLTHGYLPSDKGYYHGGDLAGLKARLPYLEELGITSIWVGPIYKNKSVQPDSGNLYGHSSGYHGYWIEDFLEVDPHLGTNAEFQALVDDAHGRGIKVLMDVITNHTADVIQLEGNAGYRNKTEFPYRDVDGQPFDDSELAYHGQAGYTFPEVNAASFPYNPVVPPGEEAVKNPGWLNDPLLYHNRGNSSFQGENSLYGDFFGLDDLWTERREVVEGMVDIYRFWIEEFGVDGFRIDTTKHVNLEFWQKWGPDILAAAEGAGIDHFFAFGEVFDQQFGPPFLSEFSTKGKLQSTIDFAFQLAARNFASQSGPTDNLRDFFAGDDYYTDADSNAYAMPTFLGNHDMGRIGYFLQRVDQQGAADAELLARAQLAHALMFFARGQPVIYYGDEQGFTGDGGDKDAREDMFANTVASYADNDLIGTDETSADDNFDVDHPLYTTLQEYGTVYRAHPALRRGAQVHRLSSDGPGVYAFSRIDREEQVEYVVALNNSESETTAAVPTFYPDATTFERVLGDGPDTLTTGAGGDLSVTVPALGTVIYKASGPLADSTAAPGVTLTSPQAGATVPLEPNSWDGHEVLDRVEVAAELSTDAYAEVTFVARVDDGDWVPIGTDDNAPYRVFYDASGLPEGATLSFGAIVDDLAGHVASDSVSGVAVEVVEPPPPGPGGPAYAVIHYNRPDGDYGDHTTGDFNDFWGLHLWGDIEETIEWTAPKPFLGEDEYGRFAWVKLAPGASNVGFIVHQGDTKDGTTADRFFDPSVTPEIWLKAGDATTYTSQADAQGYVTIRYHRPDGNYGDPTSGDFNDFWGLHLWGEAIDPSEATEWTAPKKPTGFDEYGAFWNIRIVDSSLPVNFIVHRGDTKDPGPDQSMVPSDDATIWLQSGDETIYASKGAATDLATIHYHRPDGDYGDPTSGDFNDFWGLHVWDGAVNPTQWPDPVRWSELDLFGPVFDVPLVDGAPQLAYIIHRGDTKDPGPDQFLDLARDGYEVWQLQGADPENPYILPVRADIGIPGDLGAQEAHWVSEDTIVWDAATSPSATYTVHWSPNGSLALEAGGVTGGDSIPLTPAGTFPAGVDGYLHLAGKPLLRIDADDLDLVPEILKSQIAVAASAGGSILDATGLQIPGVLDDRYAYDGELGVTWDGDTPTLRLWAPTARSVTLHLFDDADPATTSTPVEMTPDPASGVWSVTGAPDWAGRYYLYEVEVYVHATGQVERNMVTDPYSLSLAANSARSQIVDLSDPALAPAGWDGVDKPPVAQPEDIALYELHVRDFSWTDETVPADLRGTYAAFTEADSDGMRHLAALADAGLTHVHLLPTFDIATIEERRELHQQPAGDLSSYPPDSDQQQAAVEAVKDLDGFNWGYDPWHYTTPEGSYATDPDGTTRVVEYREMVQALNETGLRVVMDVVYNHTNASGQAAKSVLDKVVPGYYHRLDEDGDVATSTCCQNTATEHEMMEKLMVDSVVTWAKQYKVDGFRFDLMGHHSKANMLAVRAALDDLTLAEDGVDGKSIYVYGEGWNFGEVQNDARFTQASQLNMAGTGIGTFNDRLRDAVRGGGPFDADPRLQGFASGLSFDPNGADPTADPRAKLLNHQDQIRVGLTGNLRHYEFEGKDGTIITGADVDYNGSPAGYTDDPQEAITYVEAHDNETLFDALQYKLPTATSMEDRVRAQVVALSTVALGQGVPFFHAGAELLRSKSLDRNSFNSGDWFNTLDFSHQDNNWGVGLPPATENASKWDFMRSLLADPALDPKPEHIQAALAGVEDLLSIRESSPLFRLGDADLVQERLTFHNTGPDQLEGLVVMSLDDTTGSDLDPDLARIVALFNANDEALSFPIADYRGMLFGLHPIQAASTDPVVGTSSFDPGTGTFTVPARTTAVFVQSQDVPACTVLGTARNDVLFGTNGADGICGLAGNDQMFARGGADVVLAGPGNDIVVAGAGDDTVQGEGGNDVLSGGTGDDTITGGPGVDVCTGGAGRDSIEGCERGPG